MEAQDEKVTLKIISVWELLEMDLTIPTYQRSYQWTAKHVNELLQDMKEAVEKSRSCKEFKYRIGTVILHKKKKENAFAYDIIDGQQRCITLALMCEALKKGASVSLLNQKLSDTESKKNIQENYKTIQARIQDTGIQSENFKDVFENVFEVVVMTVQGAEQDEMKNITLAFQLFDSQNARGKSLYPHDLLKAYHLREIKDPFYQKIAVQNWESHDADELNHLFSEYLFPILQWSRKEKAVPFREREIGAYKGVKQTDGWVYARRAVKAVPVYQLTEPVVAGEPFFNMVDYYKNSLVYVQKKCDDFLSRYEVKRKQTAVLWKDSRLAYVKQLFYAACFHYYDKFGELDGFVLKNFLYWAFALRAERQTLLWKSLNKYAVGEGDKGAAALFYQISVARLPRDIDDFKKPENEENYQLIEGENKPDE